MTLRRTSKDLNFWPSSFLLYWDKIMKKTKILTHQRKQRIPPKEFLSKNPPPNNPHKKSSQKNPLKKNLPKKFSQKNTPKKFHQKKILQKILQKNSKKIPNKFQKLPKQFLKKFLRFWKYPIPYIALRGQKPFRACCCQLNSVGV